MHDLDFPALNTRVKTKRKVETLYIEADEDLIHLQFKENKGDIKRNRYGRKKNGLITKLIYVREGLRKVAPASSRKELINPTYFANCCHGGKENEEFWDEVYDYIESTYELKHVKNIYFSSDGGKWIQAGANRLGNVTYVLDEFHLNKYLHKITGKFPKDSNLIFNYLKYCIVENDKELFKQSIVDLKYKLKRVGGIREISVLCFYVLSNWDAARRRIVLKNKILVATPSHSTWPAKTDPLWLDRHIFSNAVGW